MIRTTLLLIVITASLTTIAQTIRIADNNTNAPTGTNIYATVQAAHDAAVAGDIVFVQPSLTNYGDLTINKQITLRGIGFNTGKDLPYPSQLNNITLTNRSDNTSNASGSVIEGIIASDVNIGIQTGILPYTLQNIVIQNSSIRRTYRHTSGMAAAENITIQNCITEVLFHTGYINQLLIHRNYLTGPENSSFGFANGPLSNVIISNNIMAQGGQNGFANTTINNVIITNNNFLGGNNVSGSRLHVGSIPYDGGARFTDIIVTNNIFYGCAPNSSSGTFERNVFTNNLSFGTTNNALPPAGTGVGNTGSNNIVNQDPLFVNAPYNTAYVSTMDFNLQASSPAKNAGSDGTDIGITGGAYPVTSGNFLLRPTSTPVIMQFNPAAMVPQNQPVKTNIKVKAN